MIVNNENLLVKELIAATQSGDAALVKKLLQTKLFSGTSAEAASLEENSDLVKLLLEFGAVPPVAEGNKKRGNNSGGF